MDPALFLIGLAVGAVLGGIVGVLWIGRRAEREAADARDRAAREVQEHLEGRRAAERAEAEARARLETWQEGAERARKEQQEAADRQLKQLREAFDALAAEALERSSKQLLDRADHKLQPFEKRMQELKQATETLEQKRAGAYASIEEQVRALRESTRGLQTQSDKLASALRGSSQTRGRWGEATLRRLVEMAGMSERCDFEEQTTTAEGTRPDLVVRLPGRGAIPVDAKAPLTAYLEALETDDETERKRLLRRHAQDVRGHVRTLAGRDYGAALRGSVDFTVMFLPGESFLAAALAEDREFFEAALDQRVLLATPVTLLALLRTVRMNWDHVAVEQNALHIREVARELYQRFLKFGEHFGKAGKDLDRAVRAYNAAVGSYESRILPSGRRLTELGIGDPEKLPEAPNVDQAVRSLSHGREDPAGGDAAEAEAEAAADERRGS